MWLSGWMSGTITGRGVREESLSEHHDPQIAEGCVLGLRA